MMELIIMSLSILGGDLASETQLPPEMTLLPKNWPIHLPADSELSILSEDDPNAKIVKADVAEFTKIKKEYIVYNVLRSGPLRISGRTISELFPDHVFYVYVAYQKPTPGTRPLCGLRAGFHVTIGIDKKGKVTRFPDNCAPFGEFLAENKVKIRNYRDARKVWNAFCEIHRKDRNKPIKRITPYHWRIDFQTFDNGAKHFVDVHLDSDFVVKSMEFGNTPPPSTEEQKRK